jgi:hypothetical protein
MAAMQHETTFRLQLGEAACAHEVRRRPIHRCISVRGEAAVNREGAHH